MKIFKDLEFKDYLVHESIDKKFKGHKQAIQGFENGFGVSVLFGKSFYSDGVETYELAVLFGSNITYNSELSDGVYGYLTKDEVTDFMLKIQLWK